MPSPALSKLVARDERHPNEPSGRSALRRGLRGERIGPEHVLVDYGCGSGRVLVQAARRPFGRVVGIEVVPALAAAARIALATDSRRRAGAVTVVEADAATWRPPEDVTHAYLYNPFSGSVFDAVIAALVASHDRRPRRLRIVYLNPDLEHALLATGRVRPVRTSRGLLRWSFTRRVCVYEVTPSADPALVAASLRRPRGR